MTKKLLILTVVLAIFLSCNAISAADVDHSNENITADENIILNQTSNELNANNEFKTFKDLNDDIAKKSEIDLDSNYVYSQQIDEDYKDGIIIDKTLTINGHGHTINSTDASKLFAVKSNGKLTLNDMILLSDYGNAKRAQASFTNMGTVILNNVTFITTQTKIDESDSLSASFYNTGTLNIINSKFVNSTINTNRQSYYGLIDNAGTLKIENTLFDNNLIVESCSKDEIYATGLIYNGGELTLNQVNVTNSLMKTPKNVYGLIKAVNSNSIILINNCNFENNAVESAANKVVGTIIYASRNTGTLTIMNSRFIKTTGARGAGVIYSLIQNTLINNTFEKNSATDNGGVIYTQASSTYINNTFKDNSAGQGGAIYTTEDLQPSNSYPFTGNTFIDNKASKQGGAIYSEGSIGTKTQPIEDNIFINNEAGEMGGAIFLRGSWQSKTIVAKKTVFQDNYAKDGSAIYNYMVSGAYISNVTYSIFDNNYGKVISSGAGSSAEYNYWGTNTPDFSTILKTFTPTTIVQITIEGEETLQNRSEYTVNFRDNADNEITELMPDFTVDLKSKLNAVPKSVTIHEGQTAFTYTATKIGNEIIKVMKNDEEITRIEIGVESIGKKPAFSIVANDVNYGEKLDLKFKITKGPEGSDVYSWKILDNNKKVVETGYVTENNEISYKNEYCVGTYTIIVELKNADGWQDLEVSDTFKIKEIENDTQTENNNTNQENNQTNENNNTDQENNNQTDENNSTNTNPENNQTNDSNGTNTNNDPENNPPSEDNNQNTNTNPTNDEEITEIYVNGNVEESGDGSESQPFKTIKEAINFGNDQGGLVIINILSGTYNEKEMKITTNMIIKSYGGEVILDAKNRGWFLYSKNPENNLTLIGLTFRNGIRYDADNSAEGGVVKTEGHIDVINCTFENNFGGTGGGINSHNGANIINSTFRNNKAEYNGAGVYVLDGETNIINCTFDNNYAKRQGGAIRIQGSTYIENSIFTNNVASNTEGNGYTGFAGNGGAVRVTDGDLNVESSIFINNSAHFAGGAISAGDDSQYSTTHYQVNINNSTFDGNKAAFGAGIEANDGINLTNSVLINNSVPHTVSAKYGQGSGIYVLSGDSILSGNTIKDNTNPDNRECAEIFSYSGNIAQENNYWGSNDNNKIKTNNGKTTNSVTTQPSVNKPTITIQTGERNKDNKQTQTNDNQESGIQNPTETNGGSQNTPKDENNQQQNSNPSQDIAENANNDQQINPNPSQNIAENANSPLEKILKHFSDSTENGETSDNTQQDNNKKTSNNMVKTNSTENLNDVNPKSGDASDIGKELNDPVKVSEEPLSESSKAHEISAIKSITENGYTIPSILIILIMFFAFVIGYERKQKEY